MQRKQYISTVIDLYKARKIEQPQTALKIARKLAGTRAQVPIGLRMLHDYQEKPSVVGKLKKGLPLMTYFVKGKVSFTTQYYKRTRVKGERGDKHHSVYHDTRPFTQEITATSGAVAKRKFIEMAHEGYDTDTYEKLCNVTSIDEVSVEYKGTYKSVAAQDQHMKSSRPACYDFIPSDDRYDKHEEMCVFDTFLGIYSKDVNENIDKCNETDDKKQRIKRLTKESMIASLKGFYKVSKVVSLLDADIDFETL